jgi:hypothetical protein
MELTILKLISVSQDPAQSGHECLQALSWTPAASNETVREPPPKIAAAISGGAASSIRAK